jgi:hypothetical protein
MGRSPSAEQRENKKSKGLGEWGWRKGGILAQSAKYTPVLRARGV